jgi:hypothetical protein
MTSCARDTIHSDVIGFCRSQVDTSGSYQKDANYTVNHTDEFSVPPDM